MNAAGFAVSTNQQQALPQRVQLQHGRKTPRAPTARRAHARWHATDIFAASRVQSFECDAVRVVRQNNLLLRKWQTAISIKERQFGSLLKEKGFDNHFLPDLLAVEDKDFVLTK